MIKCGCGDVGGAAWDHHRVPKSSLCTILDGIVSLLRICHLPFYTYYAGLCSTYKLHIFADVCVRTRNSTWTSFPPFFYSILSIPECKRDGDEKQYLQIFWGRSWKIKNGGWWAVGQVLRHSSEPIFQRPSLAFHRVPWIGGDQRRFHPRSRLWRGQHSLSSLGNEYIARIESLVLRLFDGNAFFSLPWMTRYFVFFSPFFLLDPTEKKWM